MESRDFEEVTYDNIFVDSQTENIENFIIDELNRLYFQELKKSTQSNTKTMDDIFEDYQNNILISKTVSSIIGVIIPLFDKLREEVRSSDFINKIFDSEK